MHPLFPHGEKPENPQEGEKVPSSNCTRVFSFAVPGILLRRVTPVDGAVTETPNGEHFRPDARLLFELQAARAETAGDRIKHARSAGKHFTTKCMMPYHACH